MLTTDQKGAIAETAIVHAAVKRGIGVSRPCSAPERYDLIFDLHPGLLRVQCKWAILRGSVVYIGCYSSRRSAAGHLRRRYDADEIDVIAAYCAELDRCYVVPIAGLSGQGHVQLRLAPALNNQRARVRWEDDFTFESLEWEQFKCLGP